MINILQLSENWQALEIQKLLVICGEYPVQSLHLMPNHSHDYLMKTIRQMREERLISETGKGQYKSLRILKKGLQSLAVLDPKAYEQYMCMADSNNEKVSHDNKHKKRNLRIAAVTQLMALAGVKTAVSTETVWGKPRLLEFTYNGYEQEEESPQLYTTDAAYNKNNSTTDNINADENQPWQSKEGSLKTAALEAAALKADYTTKSNKNDMPYFYNSREMKRCDKEGIYKTSFTRVIGLYVTEESWYGVFNMGNGMCEWNANAETKSQGLMETIIDKNRWRNNKKELFYRENILIARKAEVAIKIIEMSEEEMRSGGIKAYRDKGGKIRRYIRLDNTYSATHFVLEDESGIIMLKMLSTPDYRELIAERLLRSEVRENAEKFSIEIDGYKEGENECIFLFFDSDLKRLMRFKGGMGMINMPMSRCKVACFDWQQTIVKQYLGDEVQILSYVPDVIENILINN